MVKINNLIFEENSYIKDGRECVYHVALLDVSVDEYRYCIPLSCSDKGQLSSVFRKVKEELTGLYEVTYKK